MNMTIKKVITTGFITSLMVLQVIGCTADQYNYLKLNKIQKEAQKSDTKPVNVKGAEEYSTKEEIDVLGISENMLAYWLVLNSKRPFVSADEGGQEFYWNQYFWCLSQPVSMFTVSYFSIVDLDNDGTEEMVLVGFPETTQVLDYQDGKVYSYQFAFRGMASITVDGVYSSASAADIGGFHRINFNKGEYEVETLAYMEGDFYEVEGVEVSEEEFFAYTESFVKAERIEQMDFTEEMLDKILLGNQEKEELYIVRSAPLEEICDENNPQKAAVPEPYLPILAGKKEFVCVTEKGEKFVVDGNCIRNQKGEEIYPVFYFSVVDMEGDGEEEVVLTCDGITLLLHALEGMIYGYEFDFWGEIGIIADDGVFKRGYVDENKYKRIISFEEDGCRIEQVEDYDKDDHERIRYYFYSEDAIAQWLE